MSNEVPNEPRSWDDGEQAVVRLRAGLRRAREVLEVARDEMLRATDPWPERDDEALQP